MTYQIGQIFPLDYKRGLLGEPIEATWFALKVAPQKERATREMLKQKGVHACYPTKEVTHKARGKAIVRKFPVITQIVYAKFLHQPNWDVFHNRRLITGVFSHNGWPIEIPGDVIRAVMGLPTVAEELEAARREMLRVREGDKAEIMAGPLSGFMVDVERVAEGRVWFRTLAGVLVEANEAIVERRSIT